ncbi:MAG: PEP-CTERM/exosortase system-associated acyltransferase [Candidatus Thiodiazotropha lotti]|nr:PEP-CTERM/exosortase system-associated acyltransferase [Candidatus Thiodiazotropha lotti]MCG8002676.1 PEP-CTERM/exosortase system-associated acyltransferase [Candidatus Thiodiazotropha lotti]MCG8006553.1 PEP-CTERM/exosortase system-associated acyltransferase [Candidatus Thiodiazotropha lotti]MCW4186296.1 PEP-CTERM/exosortase system-associated acyltransferase [Candidatus Thiodiazotropha lotti]MCW4194135.1 PEP-CTERM/exosortase system-associated acyltransferase [Candidatus Thiodiazotropha lotti
MERDMERLAQNFFQFFNPRYAASRHQKRFSYSIRYKVYAEELGWEPSSSSRLETDHCDAYSHHCLLEHIRSGDIAGCVRLVVPSAGRPDNYLPYQLHQIPNVKSERLLQIPPTDIGEISRLAVPLHFRRRANETGKPFILDSHNTNTMYTEEERRNFPNIAIGLYLSSIALVDLCRLKLVLVVMEPRLQRHLGRFGLQFHKISDDFELHGKRALFELPSSELTSNMPDDIRRLYDLIKQNLAQQPWQIPGNNLQLHSNEKF